LKKKKLCVALEIQERIEKVAQELFERIDGLRYIAADILKSSR